MKHSMQVEISGHVVSWFQKHFPCFLDLPQTLLQRQMHLFLVTLPHLIGVTIAIKCMSKNQNAVFGFVSQTGFQLVSGREDVTVTHGFALHIADFALCGII